MIKKKKPYKPTKNVIIKNVQKPYAEMYDFLVTGKYGPHTEHGPLSPSEAFNDMVMIVADDYLGVEEARELLQTYKNREHAREKMAIRNEHS